jgi:hypothetical protein
MKPCLQQFQKSGGEILYTAGDEVNSIYVFHECKIKINKMHKEIEEVNTKDLYWHYIDTMYERLISENKWDEHANLGLTKKHWKSIYNLYLKLTKDNHILNL